ncbi:hypothetical protein NXH76_23260 [Blautia schinkii]|nr:hypothetical protein [Blautia schinkii]
MKSVVDILHEKFVAKNLETDIEEPEVSAWLDFLDGLPEAKTNIEKAYNKYLCRMYFFPALKRIIMNILGFFADIVAIMFATISNKPLENIEKKCDTLILEKSRDVPDFSDVVPQELYCSYKEVIVEENYNKKFGLLCKETRTIWFSVIRRYPFKFFFHYWVYMELVAHSFFFHKYNPEAVAVYVNERNVASPIITELYEKRGRKFISFMHGEYLLKLIQAHMKFSKYYVWDDTYIEMFRDVLKCEADFIAYKPKKLTKRWHLENSKPTYYCTYYFGDETEKTIYEIAKVFQQFENQGYRCKIRLHPRDIVHTELIKKVFERSGIEIEDNKKMSLEESLAETQYVVGMQTTVLFEALTEGKKIVIDDISDPKHFKNLQDRWYRLLKCDHALLSELINQ